MSSLLMRLGGLASDPDQVSVDSITLFVTLICACIVIGHLLKENRWINESISALFIVSSAHFYFEKLFDLRFSV